MVPLAEHSRYAKYFRMLRVGLPRTAVLSRMRVDGVDERLLDRDPAELVPASPLPSTLFGRNHSGESEGSPADHGLPHLAKIGNYSAVAHRLLAADAKEIVNCRDRRLNTALMQAVHGHHLEIAALLLQHGADTELKSYVSIPSLTTLLPLSRRRAEKLRSVLLPMAATLI